METTLGVLEQAEHLRYQVQGERTGRHASAPVLARYARSALACGSPRRICRRLHLTDEQLSALDNCNPKVPIRLKVSPFLPPELDGCVWFAPPRLLTAHCQLAASVASVRTILRCHDHLQVRLALGFVACRWTQITCRALSELEIFKKLYDTKTSKVYHAQHRTSGRHIALKCYMKRNMYALQKVQVCNTRTRSA